MREEIKTALKRRALKGLKGIKWYVNSGTGYLETVIYDPETKQRHHQLQHRLIWETCRDPIPEGGVIHHKNGIPTDNRIENLELLPSHGAHISHHRGQERAKGVARNCPHCQQEFVAFNQKKYCSDRCRYGAASKRWRQRNPGRHAPKRTNLDVHPRAKLTATDIAEIRRLLTEGMTCRAIADQFNMSRPHIARIKKGKSWKQAA